MREERLILACIGDSTATVRDAIAGPVDWDRVVELSRGCKVAPLVYYAVKPHVSAAAVARLHAITMRESVHWMELSGVLDEILEAFRRQGIDALLLKGAAMASVVYCQPALRMVGDLDILIRRSDVDNAVRTLSGLGFEQPEEPRITPEHHHLPAFFRGETTRVELHTSLASPAVRRIDEAGLWRRARQTLAPEHMLLHAVLHMALSNGFFRAHYQLRDIRETAERYADEIDWDFVMAEAERWSMRWQTHLVLNAARTLAGAAIPERVLESLAPPRWSLRYRALAAGLPRAAIGYDHAGPLPAWMATDLSLILLRTQGELRAWSRGAAYLLGKVFAR